MIIWSLTILFGPYRIFSEFVTFTGLFLMFYNFSTPIMNKLPYSNFDYFIMTV